MQEAKIFDIQRFSLHDGPGIRTLIFFKGCSLACEWCSNPEGISFETEIRNDKRLCIGCGKCVQNCPVNAISMSRDGITIDREICQKCGSCVRGCDTKALSFWGKTHTVQELYEQVKRDKPFYESSGGGVTLGGGDPLLQNEAAVALLAMCKENGISTAIETAGNYPWEYLEKAAPYCDIIHIDLKGWDSEICKKQTGAVNTQIIDNLQKLDNFIAGWENKPQLIVRTILLPDYNYSLEDYRSLAEFLAKLQSLERVEIVPFHNLGQNKYDQLEKPYRFHEKNNLKAEDVEGYRSIMESVGLQVRIISF